MVGKEPHFHSKVHHALLALTQIDLLVTEFFPQQTDRLLEVALVWLDLYPAGLFLINQGVVDVDHVTERDRHDWVLGHHGRDKELFD